MARFLILLFCLFFGACGKPSIHSTKISDWIKNDDKLRVLATTPIIENLVELIGGEHVKVIAIINGDQDPHSYEVVKGDGEKFTNADLVFANGLMLEHSGSMQYQLKHHENVVFIGDVLLKKYPSEMIYVDGQVDPHIWMDVNFFAKSIDVVVQKLSAKDPVHKEFYFRRGEEIYLKFAKADIEIKEMMGKIPENKRYLVTSHDAFNYFVRRYFATSSEVEDGSWQVRMQALQGLAPDEQISILQIKEIVDHICKYDIDVIFPESNLSKDSLEKVKEACKKRGKEIHLSKTALYGDTLGGKSYLEMMQYDAEVLLRNLDGSD